jgi:hypothetical protein
VIVSIWSEDGAHFKRLKSFLVKVRVKVKGKGNERKAVHQTVKVKKLTTRTASIDHLFKWILEVDGTSVHHTMAWLSSKMTIGIHVSIDGYGCDMISALKIWFLLEILLYNDRMRKHTKVEQDVRCPYEHMYFYPQYVRRLLKVRRRNPIDLMSMEGKTN